jgi:two-component system sensor histidine kinase/response regulator
MNYPRGSNQLLSHDELIELYRDIYRRADKIINVLLALMFLFGIFIAFFYDTWLIALGVGGLCLLAYYITKKLLPESNIYQYVLSAISAIFAAQYIYQMHGMAEMHFWVFISSTVLIVYQNWKLQIPLILIVCIHHGSFAYLQFSGYKEIYFTQLDYMDLTTFVFHAVLAACVTMVSAFWSYRIHSRTVLDASNLKIQLALHEELEQSSEKMDELNKNLATAYAEIQNKNEELEASEEGLKQINENLNGLVIHRTEALENQNKKLREYAFINAHKVRSPLARILGLINLIKHDVELTDEGKEIMGRLLDSSNELDGILNEVKINLENAEFKDTSSKTV